MQFSLDALQGVVHALDMPPHGLGDLHIAFPLHVEHQHLLFKVRKHLADAPLDEGQVLAVDEHGLGVGGHFLADDVQQRAVAFLVVDGLVERHVAVEGNVLLPRGRLDGGDDLAGMLWIMSSR